jgi:hypothetical protein
MIAMIHWVSWFHTGPFKLSRDAEELLRHPALRQHAEYTAENIDYVHASSAYEFVETP